MTRAPASAPVLFAMLCIVWGTSWIAMKLALAEVPPFSFTVARSVVAGAAMLAISGTAGPLELLRRAPGRMLAVALLTNTLTYAGLYWGTARASTGLAAIVNNALMPVGLFAFGLVFREEAFSRRRLAGIALGGWASRCCSHRRAPRPAMRPRSPAWRRWPPAPSPIAWARCGADPCCAVRAPIAVGSLQMLAGGLMMVPIAVLVEQPGPDLLAALARPVPLASLLWLSLAAGAAGLTIYLRLIRDWGPTRAGMYAFVSPLIAVVLGALVLGERLGPMEWIGGAAMLAAAALVLPGRGAGWRRTHRNNLQSHDS